MIDLKKLRKGQNLSQLDLAKKIGCDRTLIGKYEGGSANMSVQNAKKLAEVFNLHWTHFFSD